MSNLTLGYLAGTKAIDIYDRCCKEYGWNSSWRGQFAQQKRLFARNATPEGYSVWMIVHNSSYEPYNEEHSWYDFIKGDTIEEVWLGEITEFFQDTSTRVTFVKTPVGYKFWGIYELADVEEREINKKTRALKTYKRIKTAYPKENTPPPPPPLPKPITELVAVEDACKVEALLLEQNIKATLTIDVRTIPNHKNWLGKKVGDVLKATSPNRTLSYRIEKILSEN